MIFLKNMKGGCLLNKNDISIIHNASNLYKIESRSNSYNHYEEKAYFVKNNQTW